MSDFDDYEIEELEEMVERVVSRAMHIEHVAEDELGDDLDDEMSEDERKERDAELEELVGAIQNLEEKLYGAIDAIEEIKSLFDAAEYVGAGAIVEMIDTNILPSLSGWVENENKPTSVRNMLREIGIGEDW